MTKWQFVGFGCLLVSSQLINKKMVTNIFLESCTAKPKKFKIIKGHNRSKVHICFTYINHETTFENIGISYLSLTLTERK